MTQKVDGPARPSTHNKRVEERTEEEASEDYSLEAADDPGVEDYGWPDSDEIKPTPVVITESVPAMRRLIRGEISNVPCSVNHVRVGAKDVRRVRLVLRNNTGSANEVYIVKTNTQPTWSGYQLAAGEDLEITHNDDVWAVCATGESATLSYLAEYEVDDNDD